MIYDSDNFQYCIKLDKLIFEYKEFDRLSYPEIFYLLKYGKVKIKDYQDDIFWIKNIINLEEYSLTYINYCLSGYYTEKEKPLLFYTKQYQVIAECIFECERKLY